MFFILICGKCFTQLRMTDVSRSMNTARIILETINAIKTTRYSVLVSLTRHILLLAFGERQLNSNKSKGLKYEPFGLY